MSQFRISLQAPSDSKAIEKCESTPEYDDEFDDVTSILQDLCQLLVRSKCIYFLISGFGDDDWNARVDYELSLFLEQLPRVAKRVVDGTHEFAIEFVEQVSAILLDSYFSG